MNTTTQRYTSPVTPPSLWIRPAARPAPRNRAPVLCLRCGGDRGHAAPRLVTFEWGRVAVPGWRG